MDRFVDCHSHVVPSGDDGAATIKDGLALCRSAARHGTQVLFATPHVWPYLTLSDDREAEIRDAYERMRPHGGLELRLGFELTPARPLLDEDPTHYVLEGTDRVLMEVPFSGPADLLFALAEHVEKAGLRPVIAHPERTEAVLTQPSLADELAERGWTLQVNATSLLGRHGPEPEEVGWSLLERGVAGIVASDGHRTTRPPHLDEAYELAEQRLGERALSLFDGSALDVRPSRTAARAASTGP
ncbi:MAG TPA: CpsB/CapC family capsule biosynthesis tyrosine phosphatase [Gaiellaceae bacterium]|nr:CpsB/CapC family capsule biosynthesis tyrosine phosphatase [Gaiellaceae bacterium]